MRRPSADVKGGGRKVYRVRVSEVCVWEECTKIWKGKVVQDLGRNRVSRACRGCRHAAEFLLDQAVLLSTPGRVPPPQ